MSSIVKKKKKPSVAGEKKTPKMNGLTSNKS